MSPERNPLSDLVRDLPERPVRDGESLSVEGEGATALTVLVEGEAEVWQRGRLVTVEVAPHPVALASTLLGLPSDATVRASGAGRVVEVPRARVRDSALLVEALTREMQRLREARLRDVIAADDFFVQPGARLVPGPYRFGPFTTTLFVVDGGEAHVRRLLPPGLHPMPGTRGRYVLAFHEIDNTVVEHAPGLGSYGYHETAPFLPCVTTTGRVGTFIPELYPDAYMAILLGREPYGFPKRLGRTIRRSDGVDVLVDHARLMRARWRGRLPLDTHELGLALVRALFPRMEGGTSDRFTRRVLTWIGDHGLPRPFRRSRVLLRRRLLSERAEVDPRHRLDELTEVPFEVLRFDDAAQWDVHDVRFQPDHPILAGRVVAAFTATLAFRFGAGRRLRRYRSP